MPRDDDAIRTKVRDFIMTAGRLRALADDEDIFRAGFVNSLFAMQLLTYVESEFAIEVDNDELSLDTFRSVDAISALVAGKRARAAAVPA
jgi:acyl carrier protein